MLKSDTQILTQSTSRQTNPIKLHFAHDTYSKHSESKQSQLGIISCFMIVVFDFKYFTFFKYFATGNDYFLCSDDWSERYYGSRVLCSAVFVSYDSRLLCEAKYLFLEKFLYHSRVSRLTRTRYVLIFRIQHWREVCHFTSVNSRRRKSKWSYHTKTHCPIDHAESTHKQKITIFKRPRHWNTIFSMCSSSNIMSSDFLWSRCGRPHAGAE